MTYDPVMRTALPKPQATPLSYLGEFKAFAVPANVQEGYMLRFPDGSEWLQTGILTNWSAKYNPLLSLYPTGVVGAVTGFDLLPAFPALTANTLLRSFKHGALYYFCTPCTSNLLRVGSTTNPASVAITADDPGQQPADYFVLTTGANAGRQVAIVQGGAAMIRYKPLAGAWTDSVGSPAGAAGAWRITGKADGTEMLAVTGATIANGATNLYRSTNGGANWTQITASGLTGGPFVILNLVEAPALGGFVLNTTTTGVVLLLPYGSSAFTILTDTTGQQSSAGISGIAYQDGILLLGRNFGRFSRYDGTTWTNIAAAGNTSGGADSIVGAGNGVFYASYNANVPAMRSTDNGLTWELLPRINTSLTGVRGGLSFIDGFLSVGHSDGTNVRLYTFPTSVPIGTPQFLGTSLAIVEGTPPNTVPFYFRVV